MWDENKIKSQVERLNWVDPKQLQNSKQASTSKKITTSNLGYQIVLESSGTQNRRVQKFEDSVFS
jgi:hypothetical protein